MLKRLRKWIRNYFGFSKTETNGFIVMIPLMLIFLSAPSLYTRIFSSNYTNFEVDQQLLDSLVDSWNRNSTIRTKALEKTPPIRLEIFNPNEASLEKLVSLGVPHFLARRIKNYRENGGTFRTKNDLGKIYDFPDSLLQVLKPYIDLPNRIAKKGRVSPSSLKIDTSKSGISLKKEPVEKVMVDINLADTTLLKSLRGIGFAYAKRIVNYRKALGGFTNLDQFGEVYGVSDSLFNVLKSQLQITGDFEIKKININLATFKELNRHPYISFDQTKDILNTKSEYGKFKVYDDLTKVKSLSEQDIERLKPYIVFK